MACWIGVAHWVGQAMCYWILPSSGIPTARTTIQAVTKDELQVDKVKSILAAYNLAIEDKLGHDPDKLAPYIERMLKMTF